MYASRSGRVGGNGIRNWRFSLAGFGPVAIFLQGLNPARRVAVHHKRLVIDTRVAIRLIAGEREVNDAGHFMGAREARLVALVHLVPHQALIETAKRTARVAGIIEYLSWLPAVLLESQKLHRGHSVQLVLARGVA